MIDKFEVGKMYRWTGEIGSHPIGWNPKMYPMTDGTPRRCTKVYINPDAAAFERIEDIPPGQQGGTWYWGDLSNFEETTEVKGEKMEKENIEKLVQACYLRTQRWAEKNNPLTKDGRIAAELVRRAAGNSPSLGNDLSKFLSRILGEEITAGGFDLGIGLVPLKKFGDYTVGECAILVTERQAVLPNGRAGNGANWSAHKVRAADEDEIRQTISSAFAHDTGLESYLTSTCTMKGMEGWKPKKPEVDTGPFIRKINRTN